MSNVSKIKWNSPLGLVQALTSMSAVYVFCLSMYVLYFETYSQTFYSIYYYCIVTLACVLGIRSFLSIDFEQRATRSQFFKLSGTIGITFLLWWLYRRPVLLKYSIWFDESTQFFATTMELVEFAASQQQPPIDYFLSNFSRLAFGIGEWQVVFHAILFSTLSLFLFILLQTEIGLKLWLAPVPILFFACYKVLLKASSEGRPISTGVYFAILWLFFTFSSFNSRRIYSSGLLISGTFLLFSIGLQPLFFLTIMTIAMLPLYLKRFSKKELMHLLFYGCAAPLVIFIPILLQIHESSRSANQFYPKNYWELWLQFILNVDLEHFKNFMQVFEKDGWILLVLPLVPALIVPLYYHKRITQLQTCLLATGSMFLYLLTFPLLFRIFWAIVDWTLYTRYFVLWPVGLAAIVSFCLAQWMRFVEKKIKFVLLLALTSINAWGIYKIHVNFYPHQVAVIDDFRNMNLEWRKVEQLVETGKQAVFIEMPYFEPGAFLYQAYSAQIYLKPNQVVIPATEVISEKNKVPAFRIWKKISKLSRVDELFFIFSQQNMNTETYTELIQYFSDQNFKVHQIQSNYFVVQIKSEVDFMSSIRQFSQKTISFRPQSPRNFYLVENLIHQALRKNVPEEANRWLDFLLNIPLPEKVQQVITRYPTYHLDRTEFEEHFSKSL